MNLSIIAVVMGIILSIRMLKHFFRRLKSIIGKKLSIIGWGLVHTDIHIAIVVIISDKHFTVEIVYSSQ